MKPFICWLGGKRLMLKHITPLLPDKFNRYHEPFLGGGALLLDRCPTDAIVGDSLPELVNVWNHVKKDPEEMFKVYLKYRPSFNNNAKHRCEEQNLVCRDMYFKVREKMQEFINAGDFRSTESAGTFLAYVYSSFRARYEKKPDGRLVGAPCYTTTRSEVLFEKIKQASLYLNNNAVYIRNKTFEEGIRDISQGDFVFVDPPYGLETSKGIRLYGASSPENKYALECKQLDDIGAKVMYCGRADESTVKAFEGWKRYEFNVSMPFQSGKKGNVVTDAIWINY